MNDIKEELGMIVEMKGVGQVIDTLRSAIDGGIIVLRISSALKDPLMDPKKMAVEIEKMVDALSGLATAVSATTIGAVTEEDISYETHVARVEEVRGHYLQKINDAITGAKEKANAHQ